MDGGDSITAAGEDERISPAIDGLAKEAVDLFSSRRFLECVEVLNRLLLKKEGDPKVLHNIQVAESFCFGCSDPRKLLHVLMEVKELSEEFSRSSGGQRDGSGIINNFMSGSKGSGPDLHQLSTTDTGSIAYADEFDTSTITLNIATVFYHLHEYSYAFSVLEPLYLNIDPIDETTALHVCLLLLDILLSSNGSSKAADVIHYLERYFCAGYLGSRNDNGNTAHHQPLNQEPKPKTVVKNSAPEPSNSDPNASAAIVENSLSGTLPDDAIEYESLYSKLDSSAQHLGRPSSDDLLNSPSNRAAPTTDLKHKVQLYKVRLLLLTRNLKAAKRELKLAMGRDSSAELLLKSQLEWARGNHHKAVRLLLTFSNRTELGMQSIFNNNLGCIYYQQRKYHIAGHYFTKALQNSSSLLSEKPLKLCTFSQDKSHLIIYNCGIQQLACGKPLVAARCFGKASRTFYNRPLLWLRLAECCLLALEKAISGSSKELTVHVAGLGRFRQLVVGDLKPREGYAGGENGKQLELSLPFARYCLQYALLLLNRNEEKIAGSSESITFGFSKDNKGSLLSSVTAYEDIQREEHHLIRQAVLCALAYLELCLENPLKAFSSAKLLLDVPQCSKMYAFLGRVYAAEALCSLNRAKEAAEYLSDYLTGEDNVEVPYTNEDREKWSMRGQAVVAEAPKSITEEAQGMMFLKPEEARGVLFVNLAAMFAVQGDIDRAGRFATEALSMLPDDSRALLAAIYVDLLQQRKEAALFKLKQFRCVRYVPADV